MEYNANGLSSVDYEHSADREALALLRKVPFFDKILAAYIDFTIKSAQDIIAKGDHYRVTAKSCPRVYKLYQTALERLNMDREPDLYIKLSYDYNACAMGVKDNIILIHSSCVQNFSDGELLLDLGHELGHIKSGHSLYYNLADYINSNILPQILGNKISSYLTNGLRYAIMDWRRKAEYTADRAGMIAALDYEESQNNMLKYLGCGSVLNKVNISAEEVLNQCEDFKSVQDDIIGKIIYITQTCSMTHPWSITRMKELENWYKSGEFNSLIEKYNIK